MVEQNTIPVALPQVSTAQTDQTSFVAITLTSQGTILVNQEEISQEIFLKRIRAELSRNPETPFLLRADRHLEYGRIVGILDELKQCGVRRISVATEKKP